MKKQYVLLLLYSFISFLSKAAVEEKLLTIHFDSDKFLLTKQHKNQLEEFMVSLSLEGDYEFFIKGHTDQDGSDSYNLILSEKRALSICSYLYDSDVNPDLTSLSFAGENELLDEKESSSAKSKNRRVQIIYKAYSFENQDELQALLSMPYQTKDTFFSKDAYILIGKEGTELHFQPNCFLTASGQVYSGLVNLELNEALDLTAFIAHGLSTICNGEMLISGGMIKISAFDSQQNALLLDSSKPICISMPTINMRNDMNVFISEDGTNWNITPQRPYSKATLAAERTADQPEFKFKTPNYEGINKPRIPTIIANPKLPAIPDSARYFTQIPWFSLNKKKLKENQSLTFIKAMKTYQDKLAKYQRRTVQREFEQANYDQRMVEYKVKLKNWEKEYYTSKKEYMKRELNQQYAEYIHRYNTPQIYNYDSLQDFSENEKMVQAINSYELELKREAEQKVNYALSMASLGWVNIDCFYGNKEEKKSVLVKNPAPGISTQVKLLFPSINSCLSMGTNNFTDYLQDGIPVSQNPVVVAYKLEEGSIYYCETKLSEYNYAELEFEYIPFSLFEERIKALA